MNQQKICCQEFWYILSGLDIQLEQYDNDDSARKNWFKVATRDLIFRLIDELMAWW